MGSNQSSLGDRKHVLRWPRRSSGRHNQLEQKTRRLSGLTVNTGGEYQHLTCANDNSARSSPSDCPSFAPGGKSRISTKGDMPTRFCPCFRCGYHSRQPKRCSDPVPGQSSDSVALLHASKRSDPSTTEPKSDSNSFQDMPKHHSQERLSMIFDVHETSNEFRNKAISDGKIYFCDDAGVLSTTEMNANDGGWTAGNENATEMEAMEKKVGLKNENWLAKRCRSFLSSRSKSKSNSEKFSPRGSVAKSKDDVTAKLDFETNELDYLSNENSCEDSGKASETETCAYLCEPGSNIRPPIAKIDSLEITSIDSLDSDDLMLDTMACSYMRLERLGTRRIHEPHEKSIATRNVCETQNLNQNLVRNRGPEKVQDLDNRCPGTKLLLCSGDAGFDGTFYSFGNTKIQSSRTSLTGVKERRHLSCPFPVENRLLAHDHNLASTPFDVLGAAQGDQRLSEVFLESSNQQSVFDGECLILDRESHLGIVNEVEALRSMLLQLGSVLIRQEHSLDDVMLLDSRNNNMIDPLMFEGCERSYCSQTGEILDNPSLKQKLTVDNKNLKTQIVLLQTVVCEQQEFISKLQEKMGRMQNSMQKPDTKTLAEIHCAQRNSLSN